MGTTEGAAVTTVFRRGIGGNRRNINVSRETSMSRKLPMQQNKIRIGRCSIWELCQNSPSYIRHNTAHERPIRVNGLHTGYRRAGTEVGEGL
jgi:hypothetical protein